MKNLLNMVGRFIRDLLHWKLLLKSVLEIIGLIIVAASPLIINLVLSWINYKSFYTAVKDKIVPGELLSYILSFITPIFFLLFKANSKSYKLPFLAFVIITSVLIYGLSLVLYMAAKNNWVEEINLKAHNLDAFFLIAIALLSVTFLVRIYVIYHNTNLSINYSEERADSQKDFNSTFKEGIKQ